MCFFDFPVISDFISYVNYSSDDPNDYLFFWTNYYILFSNAEFDMKEKTKNLSIKIYF